MISGLLHSYCGKRARTNGSLLCPESLRHEIGGTRKPAAVLIETSVSRVDGLALWALRDGRGGQKRPSSPRGRARAAVDRRPLSSAVGVARTTISRHTPCAREGCADRGSSERPNSAHPRQATGVCGIGVVAGGRGQAHQNRGPKKGRTSPSPRPSDGSRTVSAHIGPWGVRFPLQEQGGWRLVPPFSRPTRPSPQAFPSGAEGRPAAGHASRQTRREPGRAANPAEPRTRTSREPGRAANPDEPHHPPPGNDHNLPTPRAPGRGSGRNGCRARPNGGTRCDQAGGWDVMAHCLEAGGAPSGAPPGDRRLTAPTDPSGEPLTGGAGLSRYPL